MMKYLFVFVTCFTCLLAHVAAAADNERHLKRQVNQSYSIYLVRHAEKTAEKVNPPLTPCGQLRADDLAEMLSRANITNIYSTQFNRTEQTAKPLAMRNKLNVTYYDPRQLKAFASKLSSTQENSLVVGHSNTTPALLQLLTGHERIKINEDQYQYLFQINVINGQSSVTILHQPRLCKD